MLAPPLRTLTDHHQSFNALKLTVLPNLSYILQLPSLPPICRSYFGIYRDFAVFTISRWELSSRVACQSIASCYPLANVWSILTPSARDCGCAWKSLHNNSYLHRESASAAAVSSWACQVSEPNVMPLSCSLLTLVQAFCLFSSPYRSPWS